MKSRRTAILCLILALCLLAGCTKYPLGTTVTCKDLQVTIPGDFLNRSEDSYAQDADFLYGWNTLVFMGLSEDKSKLQEMTLEAYTSLVISGNGRDCTPKDCGDGFVFTYEATIADTPYTYTTATIEGPSNFWILQFYCPSENLAENQPEIDIILESIQTVSAD